MVSPACCNRETPRIPFYVVPAGLALLSSLIILLVYAPATSLLLHTQRLLPAAVGAHVDHFRNPPGSSVSSTPANHSVADATLGNSSGVPTSASSGKAPPFPAVFEVKRDEWEWVKEQTPAGDQRKGNIIYREVFHDKEFFLEGYKEMNRSFKIFVYPHYKDDPFAHALLPVDFEPGGNYASESYFKKVLMQSHFITKDASEADLFFLPFSIARLRHDHRVSVGGIPGFVQMYIFNISRKYPYWNRTGGADHFYVACHSAGRSATDKAEEVKFNAIQVVCSASYYLSGYVAHKDVCLPQVWPRKGPPPKISSAKRKKLAFFAGSVNSPVRKKLLEAWKHDTEISVHSGHISTSYTESLLSSKFCLHVKGFEVNTARIADAMYYGCVPVIIAEYYDLPFSDVLNWKNFSIVVAALDIPQLKEILHGVSSNRYMELHKNVLKARKHFQWHLSPLDYDAFYMVMYELWLRRSVVRFPLYSLSDSNQLDGNLPKCV
uniref:Putative glycosyltransferase At5g03795 n=1 Tax=Anthurium amnicola TaxID=1678845 RepID=A0A1D1Z6W8_9ARAE